MSRRRCYCTKDFNLYRFEYIISPTPQSQDQPFGDSMGWVKRCALCGWRALYAYTTDIFINQQTKQRVLNDPEWVKIVRRRKPTQYNHIELIEEPGDTNKGSDVQETKHEPTETETETETSTASDRSEISST